MRIFFLSLIIVLAAVPSYADGIFPDSDMRDIWVSGIDEEQESAVMRNSDGEEAVVFPGDTIGYEEAVVMEISRLLVIARSGKTVIRMSVAYSPPQSVAPAY